jgi:hypothetical protein
MAQPISRLVLTPEARVRPSADSSCQTCEHSSTVRFLSKPFGFPCQYCNVIAKQSRYTPCWRLGREEV